MLPGNGPSGSGSVLGVGTPNSPNGLSVTAAAAFVVTAAAAAIAAAPLISFRRSRDCLSRRVNGVVMISSAFFVGRKSSARNPAQSGRQLQIAQILPGLGANC